VASDGRRDSHGSRLLFPSQAAPAPHGDAGGDDLPMAQAASDQRRSALGDSQRASTHDPASVRRGHDLLELERRSGSAEVPSQMIVSRSPAVEST